MTAPTMTHWPEWLMHYDHVPDDDHAPLWSHPPTMIILHSGARSPHVSEYLANEPDDRYVSAHFAWHEGRRLYVQMVSLRCRAAHAGPTGNAAIGIEMSGPWDQQPRDPVEISMLRVLVTRVQAAFGWTLEGWLRHSEHAPKRKKDPGPGLLDEHMSGLGLAHMPEWRDEK